MKYYRRKYAAYPVYEWLETGILLCLAGGFLDAYTYVTRGGVFANAQTANLILMTLGLATGKGAQALKYLVPILFFFCGVTLSELALHAGKKRRSDFRAHAPVLAGEAAVLVLIGALPAAADDTLVNALASFAAALQFDNFRKLEGNPFATAFCTGNLRSATEHLFHAAAEKSRAALKVSGKYFACILAFLAGVVAGYFASRALGGSAAFLDAGLLALAAAGVACGAFFRTGSRRENSPKHAPSCGRASSATSRPPIRPRVRNTSATSWTTPPSPRRRISTAYSRAGCSKACSSPKRTARTSAPSLSRTASSARATAANSCTAFWSTSPKKA